MATIHNGFIDRKFHDSFKDTGLNDVDISTTKMYKGVKPMWQQLGFDSNNVDKPDSNFYWNNILPKSINNNNITFENLDGISIRTNYDTGSGARTPKSQYKYIFINTNVFQDWEFVNSYSKFYHYPVLPKINKFGMFEQDVNVETTYGSASISPITNLDDNNPDLILNIDFDQTTTDDLIDKTDLSKIHYNQDFEVSLDNDLRLKSNTLIIPDGIEKNNSEQAF
tara:strand:- start:670 stop:1341 length:672 start_codon:yes stop_codon:yes gene_type:complete